MLPTYIYESLPAAYISVGIALISQSTNNMFLFSGTVFYICGAVIWIMRSNFRRKDRFIAPKKNILLPEMIYEILPFVYILLSISFVNIYLNLISHSSILIFSLLLFLNGYRRILQRKKNRISFYRAINGI